MAGRWTILVALCCACRGAARAPPAQLARGAAPALFDVSVVAGAGGRVTSSPPGIDCPGACTASFPSGTAVNLAAIPDATSAFAGWSGGCAGDACTLTSAATATATFVKAIPLEVRPVEAQNPAMRISTQPMRVFIRQWVKLEALFGGAQDSDVAWSVQEPDGGAVADDGTYTAPSAAGVFHVVATGRDNTAKRGVLAIQVMTAQDVYDYGGPVMPVAPVELLWWGAPAQFDGAVDLFHAFLAGVNGSAWLAEANQYLRGDLAQVTLAEEHFDASNAPAPDAGAKICAMLAASHETPLPGVIYTLVVSGPAATFDYHATVQCPPAKARVPVIVLSLAQAPSAFRGACSPQVSPGERLLWAFSHELVETMTDPVPPTGWTDVYGQEVADLCADATCQAFPTGTFTLTPLFSSASGACAP